MQELLLSLYACSSAPERWPAMLDQLCQRLAVISAVVQILDYREGRFHPVWTVRDSHSTAQRHEHDRVFNNDSNPRLKIGMGGPPPQAALSRDEEVFPPGSAELAEIQRRRRLLRLGANLTGVIELAPGRCLALVLHRSAACDRPLGAEEEVLVGQLLPHLRQAVELGGQVQAAARQADLLRDASERLGAGMALCDGAGRLIWANAAARAILNDSPALRLMAGHVRAVHPGDARPLRALMAQVAAAPLPEPLYLTLGRGEGDAMVQVMALAAPLTQGAPPAEPRDAVVLLLSEPGRPLDVSPALVADLFGLSLAEARLTAGLCNGLSLGDYARQRGISVGTARIQLKRALAKTGCPRQAELVRRVCASLAVSVAGRQPSISHLGDAGHPRSI
ncbi:helix-turn-helix transcriptional regulator [Nitrospirillum sp. BR 11828]|uniref:helix-turn-helix transcriptional regulator n=1 Tax=Nitrospirillum sp. BR 11828 TaxID=3104325 RepID=UPI002ACAD8F0|nr:helix-turn-helix transcriptional regulator [Nitrospirillum sp. BR 11828]MDZ5646825.1 helix-turn-helix transcriptional regulator [Nitrospirillum sp. BR 11828]